MKTSGGRVMLKAAPVAPKRDVLAAQINSGLLRQETGPNHETLRVVNGHALALSVQSLIPVTGFGGIAPSDGNASIKSPDLLGVRPMGKTKLDAVFSVFVLNIRDSEKHPGERHNNLRVTTIENGVPEAIWGRSQTEGVVPAATPEANTITATLGIRIAFAPIPPSGALPPIDIEKFKYETFDKPIPWEASLAPPEDFSSGETGIEVFHTAMSVKTKGRRKAVRDILVAQSPFLNEVDLTKLAENPESYFQADPIICRLGSRNESIA